MKLLLSTSTISILLFFTAPVFAMPEKKAQKEVGKLVAAITEKNQKKFSKSLTHGEIKSFININDEKIIEFQLQMV